MGEYPRNSRREKKPGRRFGSNFGADRPRGRFDRDSDDSSGRSGGRSGGRFRRDAGRSDRQSPEMHSVVCDKCGRECTVPFRPTSGKPVYCSDCFRKKDDSFARSGSEPKGRSDYSAEDLAKINQKLDKIMQALNIE